MSSGKDAFHAQRASHVRNDIQGGQPKRFRSGTVMGMDPKAKVPFQREAIGEAPTEKRQSEAEKQIKDMVRKQLETHITLQSELSRKRKEFSASAIFKDEQEKRAGTKALSDFKTLSEQESEVNQLRNCGLADEEIMLRMKKSGREIPSLPKKPRYGQSADAEKRHLADIESRIQSHDTSAVKPDTFTSAKSLTRLEMEIERSLHRGTDKADKLKHLVTLKEKEYHPDDPVIATLKEYEETTRLKLQKSNNKETSEESDDDDDAAFIGPLLAPLHQRISPLDEKEVQRNKLNVSELKLIEKFKNYVPGEPNNDLYIKNLAKNVCKEDLAALFVRYENTENPSMDYRVMEGRMKGQAFVTFPDVDSASKALEFANGYNLRGKPIVISYGRGNKT